MRVIACSDFSDVCKERLRYVFQFSRTLRLKSFDRVVLECQRTLCYEAVMVIPHS